MSCTEVNSYYDSEVEATTQQENDLPAYWMVNGNVRYRLGRLTLVGSVYNLLDEDARVFTQSPIPVDAPGRGRAFRIGLELEF